MSKSKRRVPIADTDLRASASQCPTCRAKLDACTGANFGSETEMPRPAAGDPSICLYCGEVLVFDAQLRLRRPAPEMRERFLQRPECRLMYGFVQGKICTRTGRPN